MATELSRQAARQALLMRWGRLDEAATIRRAMAATRVEQAITGALQSPDRPDLRQRQRLAQLLLVAADTGPELLGDEPAGLEQTSSYLPRPQRSGGDQG